MADSTDRLQRELARTRDEVTALTAALQSFSQACSCAEEVLRSGASPAEAHRRSRFPTVRDELFERFDRFNHQLAAVRAEGVRVMVDVEGRSLTEVAAFVGRSRQFVTRLYRMAKSD